VNINVGKNIRMSDFIDSKDDRSLLLDLTVTSSVGAQPGTENISEMLKRVNTIFDGVILNPGQLEHHANIVGGKSRAAPMVRVDWTNAYRDKEFCLPAATVTRVSLSDGEDALTLGASAAVATFLLGFGEDLESENIKSISLLARECYRLSLPLVVDIRPIGGNITADNYQGSIKLGASFMMEAGADALILPECDLDTCKLIGTWATIPIIMRCDDVPTSERAQQMLAMGMTGIVLSEKSIPASGFVGKATALKSLLHQ
jgi:DhnA family fructose-bisphosphate aldolase class Ia